MSPSAESGALAKLYGQISSAFPKDLDPFSSRCVYNQIEAAAAECPGVSYEDFVLPQDIFCKWIRPEHASQKHAVLFMHGGAYSMGSPSSHRKLAAHLAKACNALALMVDYRLAPEHKYPAALDDCLTAYQWLLNNGLEGKNVVMAGDSAGANLSVAISLAAIAKGLPKPGAVVALSPWCDLTSGSASLTSNEKNDALSTKWFLDTLARSYAARIDDPMVSVLFADNLQESPPIWISCGSDDMLRDDGVRLAEKMRKAGAEVALEVHDGQQHVFELMAGKAPEADESLSRIGKWIREKIQN
nr:esterase [Quercus suber]